MKILKHNHSIFVVFPLVITLLLSSGCHKAPQANVSEPPLETLDEFATGFTLDNRDNIMLYYDNCYVEQDDCSSPELLKMTFTDDPLEEFDKTFPKNIQEIILTTNSLRETVLSNAFFIFDLEYTPIDEDDINEDDLDYMLDDGNTKIYVYKDGNLKIVTSDSHLYYHSDASDFNNKIDTMYYSYDAYIDYTLEINNEINDYVEANGSLTVD